MHFSGEFYNLKLYHFKRASLSVIALCRAKNSLLNHKILAHVRERYKGMSEGCQTGIGTDLFKPREETDLLCSSETEGLLLLP